MTSVSDETPWSDTHLYSLQDSILISHPDRSPDRFIHLTHPETDRCVVRRVMAR